MYEKNIKYLDSNHNRVILEDEHINLARYRALLQVLDHLRSSQQKNLLKKETRSPLQMLKHAFSGASGEIGYDIEAMAKIGTMRSGIDYNRYKHGSKRGDLFFTLEIKCISAPESTHILRLKVKEKSFYTGIFPSHYGLSKYDLDFLTANGYISNTVTTCGVISRPDFIKKKNKDQFNNFYVEEAMLSPFDIKIKEFIDADFFESDNNAYIDLLKGIYKKLKLEIQSSREANLITPQMSEYLTAPIHANSKNLYIFNSDNSEQLCDDKTFCEKDVLDNTNIIKQIKNSIKPKRSKKPSIIATSSNIDFSKLIIPKIEPFKW